MGEGGPVGVTKRGTDGGRLGSRVKGEESRVWSQESGVIVRSYSQEL